MNIYIPIEVKVRELESRSLLAFEAAERGHLVILGEKKDTLNPARDGVFPPGIVFDKSLTPGEYKIVNFTSLKKNGHVITAQDEESGLLDESFDLFAKQRFSEETIQLSDKIYCWGEHDYSALTRNYSNLSDHFKNTGSPRVDIWRPGFDPVYKVNRPHNRPYILIASNFGYPLDRNPLWNRIARLRKAGYFERDEAMERYMYVNNAYQHRLLFEFIEMIRKVADTMPGVDIIVRPHPVESVDAWKKMMGSEHKNVLIKREGGISKWIRHSLCVIHNGCTSAVEAAVSRVPAIAYRPIPNDLERDIPNNLSEQIFSSSHLIQLLFDLIESDEERERLINIDTKILNNRFSNAEGPFAYQQIIDDWENLASEKSLEQTDIQSIEKLKPRTGQSIPTLKNRLNVKVYQMYQVLKGEERNKNQNGKLLKTGHKFPDLKDEEMLGFLNILQSEMGLFKNVNMKRYDVKSFIIYNKRSI